MANTRSISLKRDRNKGDAKKSLLVKRPTNYKVPKKAKSWGVGVLVSAIVVILPAKYIVLPLHSHYVSQKQALLAQDALVTSKINEGLAVRARPTYYQNEKSKITAALPLLLKQEDVINAISALAQKDNLAISSLQVQGSSVATTGFVATTASAPSGNAALAHEVLLLGNGQFSDITNFIHDLQAEPQLYQVTKVQVSQFVGAGAPAGVTANSSSTYTGYDTIDVTAAVYTAN